LNGIFPRHQKTAFCIFATFLTSFALLAQDGEHSGGLEGYEIGQEANIEGLPRQEQQLVDPPALPEHNQVAEGGPKIIEVELTVEEREVQIEPDTSIWTYTYNGTLPGPMIVAHVGDYIELTLKNSASSQLAHNIDFHAATGALGEADLTQIGPGQEVVLRWKAIKAGAFVYHCAPGGELVAWHSIHGMNGAVLILPRDGLKDKEGEPIRYDRAYYIGEQSFYVPKDKEGNYLEFDSPSASYRQDLKAMKTLRPTHIFFGNFVGDLTGENALKAEMGETVLFLHSQVNRRSFPHLIGGHADYVWERGNLSDPPQTDLETWDIAAGSAGAAVYTFRQPGTYVYLSHQLVEAFLFNARAEVMVDGPWNNDLMEQVRPPAPIED